METAVVIGGSAGSVMTLMEIVSRLPAHFATPIFIVIHIPPLTTSHLPRILNRSGPLPTSAATDRMESKPGHIYLAPPDRHLVVEDRHMRLIRGPHVNHSRPAIDPLFRSIADTYRAGAIGILLSGFMDDGVAGLIAIREAGGITAVQDPDSTPFPDMPQNAIQSEATDTILTPDQIPQFLVESVNRRLSQSQEEVTTVQQHDPENTIIQQDITSQEDGKRTGGPSTMTCPECGGVLWEFAEGNNVQYHCHVGHIYSAKAMLEAQGRSLEAALWSAMRALEEKAMLSRRLAARVRQSNLTTTASRYEQQATAAETQANLIREFIERHGEERTDIEHEEAGEQENGGSNRLC